jgi:hypothetical protein
LRRAGRAEAPERAQQPTNEPEHEPDESTAVVMPAGTHRPSPADLAELSGAFALTASVQDPEPVDAHHDHRFDEVASERGLRGLVGSGSTQVAVPAAMRARDASRPGDEHLAAAAADLPIVRRGWVPRDELPRSGRHP